MRIGYYRLPQRIISGWANNETLTMALAHASGQEEGFRPLAKDPLFMKRLLPLAAYVAVSSYTCE